MVTAKKRDKLIKTLVGKLNNIIDYVVVVNLGDEVKIYNSIQNNTKRFLNKKNLKDIKKALDIFDKYYYSSKHQIVSDMIYDKISDYYYENSSNIKSDKIGSEIVGKKVKLPVHMGSMDKLKLGQAKLATFLQKYKNNKLISSKLDGISMLIGRKNKMKVAYTRGNGTYGKDLSRFLKHIKTSDGKSLSDILTNVDNNTYIRGELIISKKNWAKFSYLGSNARNMAMGITNRKKITKEIAICQFLAYELISEEELSIRKQFKKLVSLEFDTPRHKLYLATKVTEQSLPEILAKFKAESLFDIDGIILQDNKYYPKNTDKNPKYAKAFKMEKYNEGGISTVIDIKWSTTKNGSLKPVILIEPVILSNVTIKNVYAYNAKYLIDNKIGKGAIVKIIRSGDVIPKVTEVVKEKFNITSDFPDEYKWGDTNLDIFTTNETNKEVILSQLEYFVKTLGIEFCKKSTLKKMFEIGIKSVKDFIKINSYKTILKTEGIKDKSAKKIFNSIRNTLTNVDVVDYISAIPVYNGISKKRLKLLVTNIGEFYLLNKKTLYQKIIKIKGFSEKTAQIIITNIDKLTDYINFYKSLYGAFKVQSIVKTEGKFSGRKFCFSGIRDKELETYIESAGGEILQVVTKEITDLIVKNLRIQSSKLKKAKKMNKNIIEYSDFIKL